MKISSNMATLYNNLRSSSLDTLKTQNAAAMSNNSSQKGQPSAVNNQPKRVYFKTEDRLFSGGNGTGLSFYIKYAEGSTDDNPVMVAEGVDENGIEFKQTIKINKINPQNATIIEMRALEAYLDVEKGGGLTSLPLPIGALGFHDRNNFVELFKKEINDMNLLRQDQVSQFYSQNMNRYLDFLSRGNS
ncbi:MAG: hypothetical protein WDA53_00970 [Bacillota bacterium]